MSYRYAVLDIESTGLNRYKEKINYIGVGLAEDVGAELGTKLMFNMYEDRDLEKFKRLCDKLKKRKVKLVWQNGKFDTLFIELHYGITLPIHYDIMLMGTAYELNASHSLKEMSMRYLGVPNWDLGNSKKTKPNSPDVEKYLMGVITKGVDVGDIPCTWGVFGYLFEAMSADHWKIYNGLLKPGYMMFRRCERTGIYLDRKKLKIVKSQYKEKEKETLKTLTDRYDINWRSPDQVGDVLYNKEKLPTLKLSQKTGKPSTDAKVLKRLVAQGFVLPKQLMEYKFYYGANSKFLNQWGDYSKYDGRIHPSYGMTNVRSSRTSCSDPNLQQVPRNKELRTLYTAAPGRVLIEADYSQLELRIACDLANEPTMIKIYKENGDIHSETGALIAGVPMDKVTKDQRGNAKAVNFGFLYGMWHTKFADYAYDSYGVVISKTDAKRFRELFFQKYYRLLQWHKEVEETCRALGGVYNMFGQFVALPDVHSGDRMLESAAIRKAINYPVQGSGSHLLVGSAVEADILLREEMDAWVVGTVHDAMLVDCPEEYADDAVREIKRIMSHPTVMDLFDVTLKVPLIADVGVGPWGSK